MDVISGHDSAKKRNSVQISLDVEFLNCLTTHVYL